jgi:hypothetical protein
MIRSRGVVPVSNGFLADVPAPYVEVPFVPLQRTCRTDTRRNRVGSSVAHDVRRQVMERNQHEGPLPHPGMRNDQVGVVDHRVTDKEHVDVQSPGSPTLSANPVGILFGRSRYCQQLASGAIGRQLDDHVEVRILS